MEPSIVLQRDTIFHDTLIRIYEKRPDLYASLITVKTIQNGKVVRKDLASSYINTKYTNPVITLFTTTASAFVFDKRLDRKVPVIFQDFK